MDSATLKIEEKLAWLEDRVASMDNDLSSLRRDLETMKAQIRILTQAVISEGAVRDASEETPPPHY